MKKMKTEDYRKAAKELNEFIDWCRPISREHKFTMFLRSFNGDLFDYYKNVAKKLDYKLSLK